MTRLSPALFLFLLTACDVDVVFPDDGALDGTNAEAMSRGGVHRPRPARADFDRDGYTRAEGDCDNRNPDVYPGAPDDQGDGVDNDCDGTADEDYSRDADGDGYTTVEGDCDDTNADVYPGADDDQGDGIDNDCDGTADEDYTGSPDADGDGWTTADGDCDDSDPNVYPGARERRDGIDNDCNGIVDG